MLSKIIKGAAIPAMGGTFCLYQQFKGNSAFSMESKKRLSSYRPNDWLHMYYSVEVYNNDGGKVEPGWQLIKTHPEENSYFGAAYKNPTQKHIIIAHRGTEKTLKDWLADFDMISRRLNEQQINAWDFAKEIIEGHGSLYTYSFTGHSLGGWLAETCLLKYQDEFVKGKGYPDAFSVTLDDPGGKELLEALQPRTDTGYQIAVDRLDRTNYVSRPHTINTALGREGSTTYALVPDIEGSQSWLMRNTLLYTAKMHSSNRLLEEFDKNTGLPKECYRIIDWPRVLWGKPVPTTDKQKGVLGYLAQAIKAYLAGDIQRGEYNGFYTYTEVNNPQTLSSAAQFRLQHGVHYRTEPFKPHVLPLRNMPSQVRQFLEDLSFYKDRAQKLSELIGAINPELAELLNIYQINEREECVVKPNTSARAFRDKILGFLSKHPVLTETKLAVLREEHILKQLTQETLPKALADLTEQVQHSQDLVYRLSFKQGTARLYQFIKPSWEEIQQLEAEHQALGKQLTVLQTLRLRLQALNATEALGLLKQHEQQLTLAHSSTFILLNYMKDNLPEAEKALEDLLKTIPESPDLDKNLLLNRLLNLKAKIIARRDKTLAREPYQEAIRLLPHDILTQSNYGGLLVDLGRAKKEPHLYVEAYRCFEKIYARLSQLQPQERPVVYSGMAYGFILLAQAVERKAINASETKVPTVLELHNRARSLLKEAISINPAYLNARLFSCLLSYDEGKYSTALQEVNTVLSLQPMHQTALMRKGFILDKLEEPEEALETLGQAKQLLQASQKQQENAGWIREVDEKILEIEGRQQRKSFSSKF